MELPKRKLHRLKNYDYSQNGYYHVTICTKDRENVLATVGNAVPGVPKDQNISQIIPTSIGKMVMDCLNRMLLVYPYAKIDCFVLMPDHIHMIIAIENQNAALQETERRGRRSLQDLIRGFKSTTTRLYHKNLPNEQKGPLWQSSFYDEIIRNEQQLYEIRNYILTNPLNPTKGEPHV